jgi:hypothetical protein
MCTGPTQLAGAPDLLFEREHIDVLRACVELVAVRGTAQQPRPSGLLETAPDRVNRGADLGAGGGKWRTGPEGLDHEPA